MKGVKVLKSEAQNLIRELKKLNLINKEYKVEKKGDFVFIPIKEGKQDIIKELKKTFNFEFVEYGFKKSKKKEFEELYKKLPIKSFDVVGDIAITIIPEGYEDKKKEIGEIIAKIANVNTVLAEINKREGEYRLQKFECIYGVDKRETIYKENNCKFLVNVEKVYFSPRLSTDRLEIAKEIKDNENVLVMFSGVQPYPIVIAKNSRANLVVGIEKNPEAYYYSKKNLIMNKVNNVFVFIDDVKKVLPLNKGFVFSDKLLKRENSFFLYKKIISPVNLNKKLGIKTSLRKEEFLSKISKIKKNLKYLDYFIVEFYLERWEEKEKVIEFKKFVEEEVKKIKKEIKLDFYVHQPLKDKKNCKEKILEFLNFFEKYDIKVVLHPSYVNNHDLIYLFDLDEAISICKKYKNAYIENIYFRPFNTTEDILKFLNNKGRLCFDISHFLIAELVKTTKEKVKEKLLSLIKYMRDFEVYYHISNFPPEASHFEKGILELDKVLPFIEEGIVEVENEDELIAKEMTESFNFIFKPLKFDRIVMPLPKGSEAFLDLAFENIKANGIIHWYQFAKKEEVNNLLNLAEKIAKEKGKIIEIKRIKEVGQIAPKTYRLRIDIVVKN